MFDVVPGDVENKVVEQIIRRVHSNITAFLTIIVLQCQAFVEFSEGYWFLVALLVVDELDNLELILLGSGIDLLVYHEDREDSLLAGDCAVGSVSTVIFPEGDG